MAALTAVIVVCRRCPRLVEWRERVAREKVARFRDETYWARPVPGFGDPEARILLPLFLFAATFDPISTYPDGLRLIVQLTPLYHGVDLIRALALGVIGPGLLVHVGYLLVMGFAGLLVVSRRLDRLLLK